MILKLLACGLEPFSVQEGLCLIPQLSSSCVSAFDTGVNGWAVSANSCITHITVGTAAALQHAAAVKQDIHSLCGPPGTNAANKRKHNMVVLGRLH